MNTTLHATLILLLITPLLAGQDPDRGEGSVVSDTLASDTLLVTGVPDSIPLFISANMIDADSVVTGRMEEEHSPSKAIMYALVLPGLGQGYNRKYFKIPIVWAALGGAVYAISYNTRNYRKWAYEYSLDQSDTNEHYLRGWRRYMELSYIALTVVYALQVVDAYVDAQLYSWDVNENLSMRVLPSLQPLMVPEGITGQSYGITCSFNLKGR